MKFNRLLAASCVPLLLLLSVLLYTPITAAPNAASHAFDAPVAGVTPTPLPFVAFPAEADSYVHETGSATNYGAQPRLRIDGDPGARIESYIRFTVPPLHGTVTRAWLYLRPLEGEASTGGFSVYRTNNDWTETGITWQNRPARSPNIISVSGRVGAGEPIRIDVSSYVTGPGTYNFVLATETVDGLDVFSREAGPVNLHLEGSIQTEDREYLPFVQKAPPLPTATPTPLPTPTSPPPTPVVPVLLSPPNGGPLLSIAPEFRWSTGDIPGATAVILNVGDQVFMNQSVIFYPVPAGGAAQEWRKVFPNNLQQGRTYYWRVGIQYANAPVRYSQVWSFTTVAGGPIPVTPTGLSPANGETLQGGDVVLRWEPVNGATEYWVRLRAVTQDRWYSFAAAQPELVLPVSDLGSGGDYWWQVAARNYYAWSELSEPVRFTYQP